MINNNFPPALTPPMGWNSFNTFGCSPSEKLIKETADAIVATGLRDAGYIYVNIDDGWMLKDRDKDGNLIVNPEMFPNGFNELTEYVHNLGLKIGIYLGCGLRTYNEKAGSLGHEYKDARQIAEWGFDFLKYDNRHIKDEDPPRNTKLEYITMAKALRESGREILFSMCEHGATKPWLWAQGVGHMWRITTDIRNMWDGAMSGAWGFNLIVDERAEIHPYARTCGWNDPDMLVTGMYKANNWMGPGCTDIEYRSHFSLWCLMAAPLIIGCDVRKINEITLRTLTNPQMIAVNQDILGIQGRRVSSVRGIDIWFKPLHDLSWAVGLYNRTCVPANISVKWEDLNLPAEMDATVTDLWSGEELGVFTEKFTSKVESHECMVVKLRPTTISV